MHEITVTVINNNDVRKIIQATKAGPAKENFLHINKARDAAYSLRSLGTVEEENEDIVDEYNTKPTALLENSGIQHFGFHTPRKKSSSFDKSLSALKVKSLYSPSTPKNVINSCRTRRLSMVSTPTTPHTPTSIKPSRRSLTPIVSLKKLSIKQTDTPCQLRKKVKERIQKMVEASSSEEECDDSDLDGNYSPSDDSDLDDMELFVDLNDNTTPKRLKGTPHTPLKHRIVTPKKTGTPRRNIRRSLTTPNRPSTRRTTKVEVDMTNTLDDYFMHADPSGCFTSDHTLNRLVVPRLAPDALKDLIRDSTSVHQKEKDEMFDELVDFFPRWITLLLEGFSIFLCGVGSKKKLLTQLQEDKLSYSDQLVINGFFPSLTTRCIMVSIFQDILGLQSYPQMLNDQLKYLKKHYNSPDCEKLYLIVNNLDGPMMWNSKMQHCISQLSSSKHVHLIASVDHINAPLLLDGTKLSLYNALWFDGTTFLPYSEETSYENSLLVQQSGDLAISSLIHVFKSLTPNAKGIFRLLAENVLENEKNPNYTGLSFTDLYKMCREAFLVNSDLTLRAQLTEFKDHKLIQTKKSTDGVENILVSLNTTTLRDFLEMEESPVN